MFVVIKNMEAQLEKALGINDLLEKDLNESNAMNADLKAAKSLLEGKISRMEEEIPSKRELQIEIDHLVEERNSAQLIIRDLKSRLERATKMVIQYQQQLGRLGEERKDALQEIDFLESRLNNATQRIRELESQANALKGEKIAHSEKIKSLDEALSETLDEKYRLHRELKETKEAMSEFRSTLADTKLRAKKSFYKGVEEKKAGNNHE
jgi:chromosome segregation ATPase